MADPISSLTRVQSIFNALIDRRPDGDPWLSDLWDLAAVSRPGAVISKPANLGLLRPADTPGDHLSRVGTVFDRPVAPPAAFLRWLLAHPEQMQVRDPINFGANREVTRQWRGKLFSGDAEQVVEAQQEADRQLAKRAAQRGRQKWWAFEGFSRIDCCLITDTCVIFVESRGIESLAPSTLWFEQRSRLWRDVEIAQEFGAGKSFSVMLAVDSEPEGVAALEAAATSLVPSYPHLTTKQQNKLARHLLGFVTWSAIIERFDVPATAGD
jgi:hypothetical protein